MGIMWLFIFNKVISPTKFRVWWFNGNQYRINDEPRGRRASKYHGKHRFLKFIFVVAVLAVAYIGLAYFTKGLPGDDTIRNLVNRFIEIIK